MANGRGVSHDVRNCIQESLDHSTLEDFTAAETDRKALLDLMSPRPGISARLLEMAECGLLERMFPELSQIHRRATPDASRRYSAAVHAVLPVRRLESLRNPISPARARFSGLLEELRAPELLTLALLLHDVGTRRDHGHARESLRLALPAIHRLQLHPAASETLQFLVRHHRQMARVAFRRDAEHPDVVARFAALVGSEELLKMLCLLTLVRHRIGQSRRAHAVERGLVVAPLHRRVHSPRARASGEAAEQDRAGLAVAMAGRPDDISSPSWCASSPACRARISPCSASRRFTGTSASRAGSCRTRSTPRSSSTAASASSPSSLLDKPRLFPNIAGVLSYLRHGHSPRPGDDDAGGAVLAVFDFTDAGGFLAQQRGAPRQIQRMLEAVVAGSVDVVSLLSDKARTLLYEPRPSSTFSIHLDNDRSEEGTVLEIVADDAPGLAVPNHTRHRGRGLCGRSRPGVDRARQGGRRPAHHS